MRNVKRIAVLLMAGILLSGCIKAPGEASMSAGEKGQSETLSEKETDEQTGEEEEMKMTIGDTAVSVKWEENEAALALLKEAKEGGLMIRMHMYGGFEQVGEIGTALPRQDRQITTQPGDIVLYSGDQIVLFYGSNSWSYTRLGRICDCTEDELTELLGNGDVTITIGE